jgi:hypothetical protein
MNDPISWEEPSRNRQSDVSQRQLYEQAFSASKLSTYEKIQSFPNYLQTTYMRKFVSRYEIYKKVLDVHGSIIECGVLGGSGVFSWAHFSEIYEPYNHLRKIIGFDTFSGFPSFNAIDLNDRDDGLKSEMLTVGGLKSEKLENLENLIQIFDSNRPLSHINKIKLVAGDAKTTIPKYIKDYPELVCSLLWLDFDTYEGTKVALEKIVPRMPKGAIIAFDELNHELWPGETIALVDTLGINNLRIKRMHFGSTVSYAEIE